MYKEGDQLSDVMQQFDDAFQDHNFLRRLNDNSINANTEFDRLERLYVNLYNLYQSLSDDQQVADLKKELEDFIDKYGPIIESYNDRLTKLEKAVFGTGAVKVDYPDTDENNDIKAQEVKLQ